MTEPMLAFYGDDLTGSVDVLDALLGTGLKAALFVDAPAPADLERRSDVAVVGIAGMTRTMSAAEIKATLEPAFAALAALGAPLLHYKICSTFDSSPAHGSIGAGLEVAAALFGPPFVALLPAAPRLGRYTAFATHFARSGPGGPVYRLDRHPTMATHPATPMREADLRLHLAEQTALRQGLVDLSALAGGASAAARALDAELAAGARAILFDAVDEFDMAIVGELLWERATAAPPLPVAGSAGVEHALVSHWRAAGLLGPAEELAPVRSGEPLLVVAGSRSPTTGAQIRAAVAAGFHEVAPPLEALLGDEDELLARFLPEIESSLAERRSVVVHTAGAPLASRPAREELAAVRGRRVGAALGALADAAAAGVSRLVVAGGDTSGDVARRLGVLSVEALAPLAPAVPICRVSAPGRAADGMEIVFKGGQRGSESLFDDLRRGQPERRLEEVAR